MAVARDVRTVASALAGGGSDPVQPAPPHRRRFWSADSHAYASPWYVGRHRVMIGFGCTAAPYYDPSPSCPHGEGSHHGIDVALPCDARLFSGVEGRVAPAAAPGAPEGCRLHLEVRPAGGGVATAVDPAPHLA